ncbi:DUF3253 domain-containing protein [Aquiflexum sp. LQ15W]|uniref:DUF3253 domain-containing protein n=1 Tax=Cognataquiflexum nitidum TaxID=2922272 RepID=UPI001F132D68|nr:DUF3253 domain-containing protein [Cognataquiflexum nitidum]MCH6199225.1 DUF3253 domain-containing protein [Cognataquiflexum nitidum]
MSYPAFSENPNVLAVAILEMCRLKRGHPFYPEEVVRWIYPESWRYFVEEVLEEMMKLYRLGKIEVTQNQIPVPFIGIPRGEVSITFEF